MNEEEILTMVLLANSQANIQSDEIKITSKKVFITVGDKKPSFMLDKLQTMTIRELAEELEERINK